MASLFRYCKLFFYVSILILAVLAFYFSFSEALFSWFFPDELGAFSTFHAVGLPGCVHQYYMSTTINRASADLGICAMSKLASLFTTPFMGWVCARLFFYALIPVSVAYFFKKNLRIPFKFGIIVALIIASIALFIISDNRAYMFGLDLAIYATATVTFFILIALLQDSVRNNRDFVLFCLIFALNLSSHEIFLIISGFFIPLFAWYRYRFFPGKDRVSLLSGFIQNALKDKKIWILLSIYLVCALGEVLAPGVAIRQATWPSSGTFFYGISYLVFALEETVYVIFRMHVLMVFVFLLGGVCRFSGLGKPFFNDKWFYIFIFSVPFFYLLITAYLLGITPSLWNGAVTFRTGIFHSAELFLAPYIQNKNLLQQGGFAIRQELFLYVSIVTNVFLAGLLIADKITKRLKQKNEKRSGLFVGFAFFMAAILCLFHPDGSGGVRILNVFFNNHVDLSHYSPEKNKQINSDKSIIFVLFPSISEISSLNNTIFPKKYLPNHETDVTNILVNHYLKANQGKAISLSDRSANLVYDLMPRDYRVVTDVDYWRIEIYSMYQIAIMKPCISFFSQFGFSGLNCIDIYKSNNADSVLQNKKKGFSIPLRFDDMVGVKANKVSACVQVTDLPLMGEHYMASKVNLSKGLNYFVFEADSNNVGVDIYLVGKEESVLFAWLSQEGGQATAWSKVSGNDGITPLSAQVAKTDLGRKKLAIIINSSKNQIVEVRWQHAFLGNTIYKGEEKNSSLLCVAEQGGVITK